MTPDQDPEIARALADMHVADHAPGFWETLDRRLDRAARAEAAGLTPVRPPEPLVPVLAVESLDLRDIPGPAEDPPRDVRTTTGELPSVAELRPPSPSSRRQKVWFVAAAAVLLVAIAGIAVVAGGSDPEPGGQAANDVDTTVATTAADETTTASEPPTVASVSARPTPETAVTDWLRAVRNGDVAAAVALTGPRSVEYMASQGPDESIEDALRAAADTGFGAMADAPDLSIIDVSLGDYEFGEVTLVAVTGTVTLQGARSGGSTTFVFPVVTTDDVSVVEPYAFSPDAGGLLEFTQPRVDAGQPNVMEPDAAIELFAPVEGTAWFFLDEGDEGVRPDDTGIVAGAPFARYDPPGELASGEHLAIVGFMSPDGEVIIGQALAFDVT